MNAISLHINYLLRHHDCVIVPGFGAFIKSRSGAMVTEEGNFLAPSTSICFNPSIVNNDGILVNSIARRNSCSYEEASLLMATYVAMWKKAIRKENRLSVRGIGQFIKGEEEQLIFQPAQSGEVRNRMIGQGVITATKRVAAVADTTQSSNDTRVINTRKYYVLRIHKTRARIAAAVMALLIVAAGAFHFISTGQLQLPQVQTASVVPLPAKTQEVKSVTTPAVVKEEPTPMENDAKIAEEATPTPQRYHIVVGAFRTQTEADNFIAANSDKGYTLRSVPSTKLIHIIAGSANDRTPLLQTINSKEFQSLYPQSWILDKEL